MEVKDMFSNKGETANQLKRQYGAVLNRWQKVDDVISYI